jgi:hypothetical protein
MLRVLRVNLHRDVSHGAICLPRPNAADYVTSRVRKPLTM